MFMTKKFSKSCLFNSYVRLSAQIYQTTETPPWPWHCWSRHDFWRWWVVLCALDTDTALEASSTCPYYSNVEHKHIMFSLLHETNGKGQPFAGWPCIVTGTYTDFPVCVIRSIFIRKLLHLTISSPFISINQKNA